MGFFNDEVVNKIGVLGGLVCGIFILVLGYAFATLLQLTNLLPEDLFTPVVIVTAVFCLIFLVNAIITTVLIGELIPFMGYFAGKIPRTHIIIALHGFVMAILIYIWSPDMIIAQYGNISSSELVKAMGYLYHCTIIYLATAVISSVICLWQITSSPKYKLGMSLKHDKYVFKKEEKEATKHMESTSEFNERIEMFIADLSSMDEDTIDHGEIGGVKQ